MADETPWYKTIINQPADFSEMGQVGIHHLCEIIHIECILASVGGAQLLQYAHHVT